jgi:serine/threonine-protein kinase RsbW
VSATVTAGASELRLTPAIADLARLYPWVETVAADWALSARARFALHVALEEAVANAAMHGFAPEAGGEIVVRLGLDGADVVAEVEDTGRPFDPTTTSVPPRPATIAEATPGGRGLGLLRHYCRTMAYVRADGRNRLTLRVAADG